MHRITRNLRHGLPIYLVLVAFAGVFLGAGEASAQQCFTERNIKKFIKIRDFMDAGQVPQAKEVLESVNLKRAKPCGRARVHQMLGRIATMGDDPDYATALRHMEGAVAEEALPEIEHLRTLYFVGQLQSMLERYKDAVKTLEAWFARVEAPAASAYYTMAVTYYQAENPDKSLEYAKMAVEKVEEPREAWYRLLLSLYLQKQDYDNALMILDDIILAYPSRAYWQQMAAIYSEKDLGTKSLATQQLAHTQGFITEGTDKLRMAQMLMVEGLPHRGAEILEEGLADGSIEPTVLAYDTLSKTLLQSREWEKALAPLERAAEMESHGKFYVQAAQVNMQLGRWDAARASLSKAFDKGDVGDVGQAHILMGIAAANGKKWATATAAFQRAQRFEKTRPVASKWIEYVEREKIRLGQGTPKQAQPAEQKQDEAPAEGEKKAEGEAQAKAPVEQTSAQN